MVSRGSCPVYGPVQSQRPDPELPERQQEATRFGADNFGNARIFVTLTSKSMLRA